MKRILSAALTAWLSCNPVAGAAEVPTRIVAQATATDDGAVGVICQGDAAHFAPDPVLVSLRSRLERELADLKPPPTDLSEDEFDHLIDRIDAMRGSELTGVFHAAVSKDLSFLEIDGTGFIQRIIVTGDALKNMADGTRVWVKGRIKTDLYGSADEARQGDQQAPTQWFIVLHVDQCKRITRPFEVPGDANKARGPDSVDDLTQIEAKQAAGSVIRRGDGIGKHLGEASPLRKYGDGKPLLDAPAGVPGISEVAMWKVGDGILIIECSFSAGIIGDIRYVIMSGKDKERTTLHVKEFNPTTGDMTIVVPIEEIHR